MAYIQGRDAVISMLRYTGSTTGSGLTLTANLEDVVLQLRTSTGSEESVQAFDKTVRVTMRSGGSTPAQIQAAIEADADASSLIQLVTTSNTTVINSAETVNLNTEGSNDLGFVKSFTATINADKSDITNMLSPDNFAEQLDGTGIKSIEFSTSDMILSDNDPIWRTEQAALYKTSVTFNIRWGDRAAFHRLLTGVFSVTAFTTDMTNAEAGMANLTLMSNGRVRLSRVNNDNG